MPLAVYAVRRTDNESEVRLRYPEENNVSSAKVQRFVSIQFVDEGDVTEAFEDHREVQIDEYETDSDDEESELVNVQSVCYTIRQGCKASKATRAVE